MIRIEKKENQPFKKIISPEDNITYQLVNYIYNSVDLAKFKFEMIQYESDLPKLLKQKYFVSANFAGLNCFLIFCKIRENYYSFLVDRTTLSYNIRKVDMEKVKIDHVKVGLDPSIYDGTILDGILVKNGKVDTFIISDVYRFRGTDHTHMNLDMKLKTIVEYLHSNYDNTNSDNTLTLTVNKVFPLTKIEHFCDKVISSIKNFKTRGLVFYPEESGTKLIFLFGNEKKNPQISQQANKLLNNINNNPIKQVTFQQNNNSQKSIDKEYKYVNSSGETVFAVLEMQGTDKIDVYNLFAVEEAEKQVDGRVRKILRRVKMGIAYVQGIDKATMCRDLLAKNTNNKALIKCKFNNDKSKWEPIQEAINEKVPTKIDEIDKQLDLIEDE